MSIVMTTFPSHCWWTLLRVGVQPHPSFGHPPLLNDTDNISSNWSKHIRIGRNGSHAHGEPFPWSPFSPPPPTPLPPNTELCVLGEACSCGDWYCNNDDPNNPDSISCKPGVCSTDSVQHTLAIWMVIRELFYLTTIVVALFYR